MCKKITLVSLVIPVLLLTGCVSGRSPVSASSRNPTTAKEVAIIGGSTVAGGLIGHTITGDDTGTAIGAGFGLVGGAVANNLLEKKQAQREAELLEQGRREERARILDEYWLADRLQTQVSGNSGSYFPDTQVQYEGGIYEGINVAPRSGQTSQPIPQVKRHN